MLTRTLIDVEAGIEPREGRPVAVGALQSEFRHDLMVALASRPRGISPKYFYDVRGSQLFDRICELPEYYPTRSELLILATHAREIAAQIGSGAEIVEFGAGSLQKVRLLLDALDSPLRYVPIDISGEHLAQSARALRCDYPGLEIEPLVADYTASLPLPTAGRRAGKRVGFFPGSTLGNF